MLAPESDLVFLLFDIHGITYLFFVVNDTATTEIYTSLFVGSVRCV